MGDFRIDPPPPPPPPESWIREQRESPGSGIWTGSKFFTVLGAWFVGGLVATVVAISLGYNPVDHPAGLAISIGGQGLAAMAVVYVLSQREGTGRLRRDVGFEIRAGHSHWIFGGLALQVIVALVVAPVLQLFAEDLDRQQQVVGLAESTHDFLGRFVLAAVFVAMAPIVEEVIFRGVLFSWLMTRLGKSTAIVISAAAFSLVHLIDLDALFALPGLFLIGLVLGWAAQKYGTLSVPILIHSGVNLTATIALFWGDEIVDFVDRAQNAVEALSVSMRFF